MIYHNLLNRYIHIYIHIHNIIYIYIYIHIYIHMKMHQPSDYWNTNWHHWWIIHQYPCAYGWVFSSINPIHFSTKTSPKKLTDQAPGWKRRVAWSACSPVMWSWRPPRGRTGSAAVPVRCVDDYHWVSRKMPMGNSIVSECFRFGVSFGTMPEPIGSMYGIYANIGVYWW